MIPFYGRALSVIGLCLILLHCSARTSFAEADAVPSLRYLSQVGEVIVTGEMSVAPDTNGATASLRITRVLKGDLTPGSTVSVHLPECAAGVSTIESSSGVWFLNLRSNGDFGMPPSPKRQACPTVTSLIEEPSSEMPAAWQYSSQLSVEDKLAYELAYSLNTSPGPLHLSMNQDAFHGVSRATITQIASMLKGTASVRIETVMFRALLESGDASAIRQLHTAWSEYTSRDAAVGFDVKDALLQAIAHIVKPDSASVIELGRVASDTSADEDFRRAAAVALRNVHSAAALQSLGPLLNDGDIRLREEAIAGIACYANGVPPLDMISGARELDLSHPSALRNSNTIMHFAFGHNTISANEKYYEDYWREWLKDNAANIE
jgi:hypothetical protein